jgi:hypothetical protein
MLAPILRFFRNAAIFWSPFALAPGAAVAQSPQGGPVVHARIAGDLDAARDLLVMKALLGDISATKSSLIVLELSGNASRPDLVHDLGSEIRRSASPVRIYLNDAEDHAVGPGQLCLGLISQSCAAAPGTTIRGHPADPVLAALAPDQTGWAGINAELYEWTGKSRPALAEGLAAAFISPSRLLWIAFDAGTPRAVAEPPARGIDAAPFVVESRGTIQVSLDAKAAARAGLCELTPAWTGLIPADLKQAPRTERALTIGLAEPSKRVAPLLARVDADEDDLKTTLKLPWPASKKTSASTYRQAASAALPKLDDAQTAMAELEKILTDYPELLRRPAPGQTDVAAKPATCTSRWRSMIQTRKDRLARHAATAEKFGAVKD